MTSRRIRVLVNPSAASGRARRSACIARARAEKLGLTLEWIESRSGDDLLDKVRGAAADDLDALAVAGGDGTVALALEGLGDEPRIPLGVLPIGSGNDFAKDVGVPRDPAAALDVLAGGVGKRCDVGRVWPGGRRFCCVASVGLDEIALGIIHRSWLPRSKALNVWAALRALWSYRPRPVRVTWDTGSFEGEVMFAAVTNTRGYGGGFRVSPAARLDDGLLDLCVVRRTRRLRLLWNFPHILRGTHGELPEVIQAQASWFRLEGLDGPLPVALDGELPRLAMPIELRCQPGAVSVLTPAAVVSRRGEACRA